MIHTRLQTPFTHDAIEGATARAAQAIPPLWPLASSVAVNPFLGQTSETFTKTAARLTRVAGANLTMPRDWYRTKLAEGIIAPEDIEAAWRSAPADERPESPARVLAELQADAKDAQALPTVAELAARVSGTDWPGLIAARIGTWAADFFDEGQALWSMPRGADAYASWRAVATQDLTPEVAGLPGFALQVSEAPQCALALIERASGRLGLSEAALETYFHRLLMTLGGWAQYARYKRWQAERTDTSDDSLIGLLAIRLFWDEALFLRFGADIAEAWGQACDAYARAILPGEALQVDAILQEATERAAQRKLGLTLAAKALPQPEQRPHLQAAFCIDVRSEPFRRALEGLDRGIVTIGFAGFFGLGTAHRRFASDVAEWRLPVLLRPGTATCAGDPDHPHSAEPARIKARAKRAWVRFKLAAVSSFAFVEAAGPLYLTKLVKDALHVGGKPAGEPAPRFDPAIDLATRVTMAGSILRAMSLTEGFARVVLLVGHGASTVNNPHASALHCGACGGYPGDVNARLAAALLNDAEVRAGLAANGLAIPSDTLFIGALHDTTTDDVTLFTQDTPVEGYGADIERTRAWLAAAGGLARTERALRLPGATRAGDLPKRSRDWSEIRPEWALAGCTSFIAAPRHRSRGKSLEGRAFLHEYDWTKDEGFRTLELILTAPVVVASWISLQYYGSTVAPRVFGSGNKLLHNVTGGIGVIEGQDGLLRGGLPWQSVHDGKGYVHEPLRLTVCVEAPRDAIGRVLEAHPQVRELFDNRWMHLLAMDEEGRLRWRYAGGLEWTPTDDAATQNSASVPAFA